MSTSGVVTDYEVGVSRYYRFKQNDGRGFGIIRLDAVGSARGTVVDENLSEAQAEATLAAYRREERLTPAGT